MASYRKSKLNDNSAFLQFNWKADVVESWIGEYLRSLFCEASVPFNQDEKFESATCSFLDSNDAEHVSLDVFKLKNYYFDSEFTKILV